MNEQITNLKKVMKLMRQSSNVNKCQKYHNRNVQISYDVSGEKRWLLKPSECRYLEEGVAKSSFRLQKCYMIRHMGGWELAENVRIPSYGEGSKIAQKNVI